jgi:hypothetical protein
MPPFLSLQLLSSAGMIRMKTNSERAQTARYMFLLAIQVLGGMALIWQQLPEFRQIAANPGEQLPQDSSGDLMVVGVLLITQIAFWYRQSQLPIPFRRPNIFLNHVLLFCGRLGFIFGSALFAVVVFRHLPELDRRIDSLLSIKRGVILVASLFALFCTSVEVERLGQAFERKSNSAP